jgi:hypothetical protein
MPKKNKSKALGGLGRSIVKDRFGKKSKRPQEFSSVSLQQSNPPKIVQVLQCMQVLCRNAQCMYTLQGVPNFSPVKIFIFHCGILCLARFQVLLCTSASLFSIFLLSNHRKTCFSCRFWPRNFKVVFCSPRQPFAPSHDQNLATGSGRLISVTVRQ